MFLNKICLKPKAETRRCFIILFYIFFPNTQFRSSENKLLENINILKGQTLLSMLDKEISVNRKLIFKPGNEQGLIFCFHFKFRIFKNVYKIY